jgi:hypothetical protein
MNKRIVLISLFIFFIGQSLFSQTDTSRFPKDWLGTWTGKLEILSQGKDKQEVDMELEITPANDSARWNWNIFYGTGEKKLARQYELIAVDREKGKFKIDEKNSIIIDLNCFNNTCYSAFSVSGILITAVYSMHNDFLLFEIVTADKKNPLVTGTPGDDVSIVTSYPVYVIQKAVLKRSN